MIDKRHPFLFMILDGWGYQTEPRGNAIQAAHTPNLDRLFETYPSSLMHTSGHHVGLPDGQMGNSEVGHLNIGAGRIVYQDITRIDLAIQDGSFYENAVLKQAFEHCRKHNSNLHLLGLVSDGGVHSSHRHYLALLELAQREQFSNVFLHAFMDGRDTSPTGGKAYLEQVQQQMETCGVGKIASISGRYYAMDRDNRWERVEKAYAALVYGEGPVFDDPIEAIQSSYDEKVTDEFVVPRVIVENGKPMATIQNDDVVLFFNFRADRAREITRTLIEPDFAGFARKVHPQVHFVCMTQYDATFANVDIVFPPQKLDQILGEVIAEHGLTQLRIAETEKYAHVTFFFNGGVEQPFPQEDRALIPSPKVATYDLQPEMSAYLVTERLIQELEADRYDLIILNFANCDMVGHTGVFEAAVKAVEAVDECVGKVIEIVERKQGSAIITADHGNAEKMLDLETGEVFTAHTTNPVPIILITPEKMPLQGEGILADLAPTILKIMNIEQPSQMTGKSLV